MMGSTEVLKLSLLFFFWEENENSCVVQGLEFSWLANEICVGKLLLLCSFVYKASVFNGVGYIGPKNAEFPTFFLKWQSTWTLFNLQGSHQSIFLMKEMESAGEKREFDESLFWLRQYSIKLDH